MQKNRVGNPAEARLKFVKAAFQREFPDLHEAEYTLQWEGNGGAFDVTFLFRAEDQASLVTIECTDSETLSQRLGAVAASLGCRIYRPDWDQS